jgi:hypothetical protein
MPKYTFIADYKGGTYISQHAGDDLRAACVAWKDHLINDRPFVDGLDVEEFAEAFDYYIEQDPPLRLAHLENVWNFGFCAMEDEVIDVDIVQTDTKVVEAEKVKRLLSGV